MAWHPFRNIGLKIAALGLAILLWITASGQQVERTVLVQLQFRNIPASLELTGDAPRTVDVRVRGAAGLISPLEAFQVVATVDLTNAREGTQVYPLPLDHISVPLGVDVRGVDPPAVSLTLERSTQLLDQLIAFRNAPAGHQVTAEPARVAVRLHEAHNGPSGLANLRVEPYVDVAHLGPGRYTLPVRVESHGAFVVTAIEPGTVAVKIQ
jgi:YbbR domain-containing protein